MLNKEDLIPKHGGYRKLKSFQVAQLAFDLTVRFCDRYIDRYSRTRDQMVQAARSGVQNIAEGSQASGTSKKTELRLTNVARASLEELRLDYEDFLRQRQMPTLPPDHPALMRFKRKRCATLQDVQAWVVGERARQRTEKDEHGHTRTHTDGTQPGHVEDNRAGEEKTNASSPTSRSVRVGDSPCPSTRRETLPSHSGDCASSSQSVPVPDSPYSSLSSAALAANAALSLLNLACHLLDRQIAAQARAFEKEGGFTERLYRVRSERRNNKR